MYIRRKHDGISYIRRSRSRNELGIVGQLDWAVVKASGEGINLNATRADLEYMVATRLHSYRALRFDDGITGATFDRPGFQAVLRDVQSNTSISHVYAHQRDRLARPKDAMEMAQIERKIRFAGVTIVFSDEVAGPLDPNDPNIAEDVSLMFKYYESGNYLRKLAERIISAQRLLAEEGNSIGGEPPYGFVRVLVDSAGNILQELEPKVTIRKPGCHVRWVAKGLDKISIWVMILDLKHQRWGGKRIANHLNSLGIPAPKAGCMRTDRSGRRYKVSGKWRANTVQGLCRNALILGIKEYGHRSMGAHRRLSQTGFRTLEPSDMNAETGDPQAIRNDPSMIVRAKTGKQPHYDVERWQEIQNLTKERGKNQRGIPRAKDPGKYPLACRVIDLSKSCGSLMYGHTRGKRRLYTCGRYMSRGECDNNTVDAEALLRVVVLSLKQHLNQFGQTEHVRELLAEAALAAVPVQESTDQLEIRLLENKLSELRQDHDVVGGRMCRERDEERQLRYQADFDQIVKDLRATENALADRRSETVRSKVLPAEEANTALMQFNELLDVLDQPSARCELKEQLANLDLWVGLEFGSRIKGEKREVRFLRGGMLVFGERFLPIPVHGDSRIPEAASNSTSELVGGNLIETGQLPSGPAPSLEDSNTVNTGIDCMENEPKSAFALDSQIVLGHQESISSTKDKRGGAR